MSTTVRISPTAALDLPALREAVIGLDADPTVDRVILGDDHVSGYSAVVLASWIAPLTRRISLVPEVPVTHTEPFHAATTTATLDHVTAWRGRGEPAGTGRGGWAPTVQTGDIGRQDAALVGLRPAAGVEDAWRHAVAVDRSVSALWTSWDRDAEIRDTATARFIDRDRVHYTGTSGTDTAGETFTVKGPSIVPQSPQGNLLTVVTVDAAGTSAEVTAALAAASRIADTVIVPAGLVAEALAARIPTVLLGVPVARLRETAARQDATVPVEVPDAADGFALTVATAEDLAALPGVLAWLHGTADPVAS